MEGDEFGLHDRVAGLPAGSGRLRVFVGAGTAEGAHEDEEKTQAEEGQKRTAGARVVQIQQRVGSEVGRRDVPASSPLKEHAEKNDEEAEDQHAREDDVGEDAQIRILKGAGKFQ